MNEPGLIIALHQLPHIQFFAQQTGQKILRLKLICFLVECKKAMVGRKNNFILPSEYIIAKGRRQSILIFKMLKTNSARQIFIDLNAEHTLVAMAYPEYSRLVTLQYVATGFIKAFKFTLQHKAIL